MFVLLIIGSGLGWVVDRAHRQRDAVAVIERAGGSVIYDWQIKSVEKGTSYIYQADLSAVPSWPKWLVELVGVDFLGAPRQIVICKGNTDLLLASVATLSSTETLIIKRGETQLTNVGLSHLRGLTRLKALSISCDTRISRDGLENLENLTHLKHLSFYRVPLSDEDLIPIGRLTSLETFIHYNPRLGDAGLLHLADWSYLGDAIGSRGLNTPMTSVGLIPSDHPRIITDYGISNLRTLENLKTMNLSGTRVTSAGLVYLRRMKGLKDLWLLRNNIHDLAAIRDLTSVRRLYLSENPIHNQGLSEISRLRGLEELALDGTRVTDAGLGGLSKLPLMTQLTLANTQVGDEGLSWIVKMQGLERLDVSNTKLTDIGILKLKDMKNLVYLNISGRRITSVGLEALKQVAPNVRLGYSLAFP